MKLIVALAEIKKSRQAVLTTADVMGLLDLEKSHASKLLARLADSGHVARVKRGLWVLDGKLDPLMLPRFLTAPFPSYVSLQKRSLLPRHDFSNLERHVLYLAGADAELQYPARHVLDPSRRAFLLFWI